MKAIYKIKQRLFSKWMTVLGPVLINGVGKLLGFVREVLISSMFGVSAVTDAFFAIQQLLVFISSYVLGAFNLAFVPAYIRNINIGATKNFLLPILVVFGCVGFVLTIFPFLFEGGFLIRVLGFKGSSLIINDFARILAVAVIPSLLIGLAYGILHSERKHLSATILGIVSSGGMLAVLLGFYLVPTDQYVMTLSLPISYLVGSVLAGGVSLRVVLKRAVGNLGTKKADFKGFAGSIGAASIENIGFNINQYSNVYYAAKLGEGLVSINAFAMRIGFLPLALISSQLGQIYQSWAGRIVSEGKTPPKYVYFSIVALSLVISIAMALLSGELVRLVYERGSFTGEQTIDVAKLLIPYAAYFFVMSVNQTAARHYFVISKARVYSVLMISAYGVALLAKSFWSTGIEDVIWFCVLSEGAVALYLSLRIGFARRPE